MIKKYVEEEEFKGQNFSEHPLIKGDYEVCTFINCVFSNADLSGINFNECVFKDCDLSLANISKTAFRTVDFKNCKLLGLHFEACNEFLFAVSFESCLLNLSSFYEWNMKGTYFKDCHLHEVDFTQSDLSNSIFKNCDLTGAIFENTNLEKTDFRGSFNFSIDPELNRIKKAKFASETLIGLLNKYDIQVE
ncbi:MAG: pentapeptide repeat-containing protein [Saprospiraceae bacterium]|jgi:uncharacterized protein YjbI with pentapeptide repeats|nr:pentapeptide repeat-containing protein [Saprospiraceae bacterium]